MGAIGARPVRSGRINSGQLVILIMFGSGLAAAGFGMWYRHATTRRSLGFWGSASAVLISRAPAVEALRFDPPLQPAAPLDIEQLRSTAAQSEDVAGSRGMLNVRQAFVEDSTFRWATPAAAPATWAYALVFSDGPQQTALLFDPVSQSVGNPVTGDRSTLEPEASRDLVEFFQEQFAPPAAN